MVGGTFIRYRVANVWSMWSSSGSNVSIMITSDLQNGSETIEQKKQHKLLAKSEECQSTGILC